VFEVDPNTVLGWLAEAAEQLQLDELYAVLREVRDGDLSDADAIKRLERSPYWVWTAMDPESKLLLVVGVGTRALAMAQRVMHHVVQVLAPDCIPLVLTDGFSEYLTALLTHYGHWVQPERRQGKGPQPKPRWMPLPQLLYAQVVKSYRRRRIVSVKHRVVFGTIERVKQVLSACGRQINTTFVERLNLDIRQRVAAVGRRVNTLCQGEDGLQHQLVVFQTYHNFVLPRGRLRQPLRIPEPTNGSGSGKRWRPCTPAMAAGLTDHVWSLREVLMFRVPPWPQSQAL
jgi:IS1 family transposase